MLSEEPSNVTLETIVDRPFPRLFVKKLLKAIADKPIVDRCILDRYSRMLISVDPDNRWVISFEDAYLLAASEKHHKIEGRWLPRKFIESWCFNVGYTREVFAQFAIDHAQITGDKLHPIHGSQVQNWIHKEFGFWFTHVDLYVILKGLSMRQSYTPEQLQAAIEKVKPFQLKRRAK